MVLAMHESTYFLVEKSSSISQWKPLGGKGLYTKEIGHLGMKNPKVFRATCSLNNDQFREGHGDTFSPRPNNPELQVSLPESSRALDTKVGDICSSKSCKVTSKVATLGLSLFLHLTLFSRAFSSVSILCKSVF